jgi:hypothetical protein
MPFFGLAAAAMPQMGPPGPVSPPQPYAVDPRSAHMAGVFGMPNQMPSPMMGRPQMPGRMQQGSSMPAMTQGGGSMPGSAGLFDQYMQGGMMPRYRPPAIAGVYGDTGRGYTGFLAPQMQRYTPPQAQIPPWIAGLLGPARESGVAAGESMGVGGGVAGDTGANSGGIGVGDAASAGVGGGGQ